MTVPFLDARPLEANGSSSNVDVERLYFIDFDNFNDADWNKLGAIYKKLPQFQDDHYGPAWYGVNEDVPPYLVASVEPPGLQVYGILPINDWYEWDIQFREAIQDLPLKKND